LAFAAFLSSSTASALAALSAAIKKSSTDRLNVEAVDSGADGGFSCDLEFRLSFLGNVAHFLNDSGEDDDDDDDDGSISSSDMDEMVNDLVSTDEEGVDRGEGDDDDDDVVASLVVQLTNDHFCDASCAICNLRS